MSDERNDGLHPRHPGRGKCAVIELESMDNQPEIGGFIIFLPSGATKTVHWRETKPITPTLEAAKEYTTRIVDSLLKQGRGAGEADINGTNWTSVAAAIQRVILDWNDKIVTRINAKMVRDMVDGTVITGGPRDRRK